jgi:Clr5 domain
MTTSLRATALFNDPDLTEVSGTQPLLGESDVLSLGRPRDPPSREDWERFKLTIVSKYVGMNIPLHEIVLDMEYCYGFKASQRMYKQRFTEWVSLSWANSHLLQC